MRAGGPISARPFRGTGPGSAPDWTCALAAAIIHPGTGLGADAMAGLFFEEFSEGQVFDHAMTRTVTEMDNVLFTTLTMNPQPLHLDAEFAKTTEFGRPLVNSIFTLG